MSPRHARVFCAKVFLPKLLTVTSFAVQMYHTVAYQMFYNVKTNKPNPESYSTVNLAAHNTSYSLNKFQLLKVLFFYFPFGVSWAFLRFRVGLPNCCHPYSPQPYPLFQTICNSYSIGTQDENSPRSCSCLPSATTV